MFKCSTNLMLLACVALIAPVVSRSSFAPRGLASTGIAATHIPENDASLLEPALMEARGGEMSTQDKAVAGATAFLILDTVVRKTFRAKNVGFPAQLGGCIMLLSFLLISELVVPGVGDSVFNALSPGAALLTKWLPVFFVPGLAMLPLAPSIGSAVDVSS